jgi:HemY protein
MIKLLWQLCLLIVAGLFFAWLADQPGSVAITWGERIIEMKIIVAAVLVAASVLALWFTTGVLMRLWRTPRSAREHWRFRKHRKAHDSLSRGLIAASAGDAQSANRLAVQAAGMLKNDPLLTVLEAQAAQLKGDHAAVKRSFEAMTRRPETEVLGLRGLFSEARQAGDFAAAIQYAERALTLNPRLAWASAATLHIQMARKDWGAAARTITGQSKSGLLPRGDADRRRAALLAAQALNLEDTNRTVALSLAMEAHDLDRSLVPAALVAGRCHIANGSARKAQKAIRFTWLQQPHPELAELMAHSKPGEDAEERFERVRDLVGNTDEHLEGAYALARAAVSARRFEAAKKILAPHVEHAPQARFCALMADIEDALDDKGRARAWLARAIHAPRDPMWVSDGVASPRWTPVSPVTGEIVPCEWKPPYDTFAMPSPLPATPLPATPEPSRETTRESAVPAITASPAAAPVALSEKEVLARLPDDPGIDPLSGADGARA